MFTIKNLTSFYGNLKSLHNVSLHIKKGEIVGILGANGAGKTTLLNSVMNIVKNKNGEIFFKDKNINCYDTADIVKLKISLTPEGRQIFDNLTVEDNLMLGSYMRYSKKNLNDIKQNLDEVYRLFPVLSERKKGYAGYLSGGEQQMLAIGRSLMSEPEILLLDEPSTGLAPKITVQIFDIIKKLSEKGISILVVEQNANIVLKYADRCYVMENGRIILQGSSEELLGNEEVKRAYLGSSLKTKWER